MKKLIWFVGLILTGSIALTACLQDHRIPEPNLLGVPPSDLHRKIAVLCMLANVNFGLVAPSEAALNNNTLKVNDALKNNNDLRAYISNDWQVVWGPVTSNSPRKATDTTPDGFVSDNTMYVAKGINPTTQASMYVVAIAGTNSVSEKGWQLEDFNIQKEADWGMPNSGKISAGSALGLSILSTMRDEATKKSLLEFLGGLKDVGPVEVAFTGHSLGGALSPLVALKTLEWVEQMGYKNISISAYPIAGPTPGDSQFASYAARKFGDTYHSVINSYDIVPSSWQKDMYARIPTLYASSPPFNPGGKQGFTLPAKLKLAYDLFELTVNLKSYQRIAQDKEYVFSGTANVYPQNDGTFLKEAGYQHVKAYFKDGFQFPQPVADAITNFLAN